MKLLNNINRSLVETQFWVMITDQGLKVVLESLSTELRSMFCSLPLLEEAMLLQLEDDGYATQTDGSYMISYENLYRLLADNNYKDSAPNQLALPPNTDRLRP